MSDLLGGAEPPISLDDMRRCARRELAYRNRVYPRWVSEGKMKAGMAERELAVMGAIVDTLDKMEKLP